MADAEKIEAVPVALDSKHRSTPAKPGAATLQDVAREAGVSLATASRVLNGSSRRVAEGFRERVETAAALLGYSPNLSAQATARGTSNVVALLVADIADPYFGELASGVSRGAKERGLSVMIATTDRDVDLELSLVRALRGQRPTGVILAASRTVHGIEPRLATELGLVADAGGRTVILGSPIENVRAVNIDNHGGARELGSALAARGYRTAVVLAAVEGIVTGDARLAGFSMGFEDGGGRVDRVYRGGFSRQDGAAMMQSALDDGIEEGTLVFGVSDIVAIGAMSALRSTGRTIGADVAVCGFDDIPTANDVTPSLTTMNVPLQEIGYEALRAITDADWEPMTDRLKPLLQLRDSTPPRT